MNFWEFLLQLIKILKGSLFAKLAIIFFAGAITSLTTPWWESILKSILEKELDIKISTSTNFYVAGFLIILGSIFAYQEYKHQTRKNISDDLAKTTENNAKLTENNAKLANETLFLNFKSQQEETCYSILRNLVNKFSGIGVPILENKAKEVLSAGNNEKLVEYIEFILINPQVKNIHKVWFYVFLGEAQTGKPLSYQFVENYEKIKEKANELGCLDLIKGSPLNNAYRNITDDNFKVIRKKALWEAYV